MKSRCQQNTQLNFPDFSMFSRLKFRNNCQVYDVEKINFTLVYYTRIYYLVQVIENALA